MLNPLMMLCALHAAQASNDNTVYFDGLFHDSASSVYVPNGPRLSWDDDLVLRLRSFQGDLTATTLEHWNGTAWTSTSMAFALDVECGLNPPFNSCVLWQGTIPASARALAYCFVAVDGTDTNRVARLAAGTTSTVLENGVQPTPAECFQLALPDAGAAVDAATAPDAQVNPPDASLPPDAASPDAAGPADASLAADAHAPTDAAAAADGAVVDGAVPDAAVGPDAAAPGDAGGADAARPDGAMGADASGPPDASGNDAAGGDAGGCVPGCVGTSQRRVCSEQGLASVVTCTGGTQCVDAVCTTPDAQTPPPDAQGCACLEGTGSTAPGWALAWLMGLGLWKRARAGR